ncbi:MAG TPA: CHAD domain-containing protein [Allosphingosinicella sp.]|nr:CHAD domain-containing protein [Allosphingosinicella sp.]
MSHEVELKFDLATEDVAALRACASLAGEPARIAKVETAYFDSKDKKVRDAGYSLRVRRAGGRHVQTVKHKPAGAAGLFVRREWESEVAGPGLDARMLAKTPLGRLLDAAGTGALVRQIRSHFQRTTWLVTHKGSQIEVVLDEGEVAGGGARAPLCELELELKAGKPRALFALAQEIGAAVPLRLGVLSKAERGYALAEKRLGEPARAEPIALAAPLSESEAFRAVAQACLRHYRLNEIVLLVRRDADALHQARIALRRLRSALSLFRTTVRGKDYQEVREGLSWLSGQLGDARNLDVLIAGAGLRAEDSAHGRLARARAKAYDLVEAALRSERVRALMLRLALWIEAGAWRFRERASRDIAGLAAHQLERQWRRVRRHGAKLGAKLGGAGADDRHRLRLDVKKLRYAAEFLAGLSAKKPKRARRDRFIAALRDLQERLGDLGDAEAAAAMTAKLAPGMSGSAGRIRREAEAGDAVAAAGEALERAAGAAGYWN